jgi:hypothetical protein
MILQVPPNSCTTIYSSLFEANTLSLSPSLTAVLAGVLHFEIHGDLSIPCGSPSLLNLMLRNSCHACAQASHCKNVERLKTSQLDRADL